MKQIDCIAKIYINIYKIMEKNYDNFWREYAELEKNENLKNNKLRNQYKKLLKGQINITGLFRHLNEDLDGWIPDGIVDIILVDEKQRGYSGQCARIINTDDNKLYLKTIDSGIRGLNHYYVWQASDFEDSYYGVLLYPLKNGKYFKLSYTC